MPYLSGERTPHNNPNAKGAFFGLTHEDTPLSMAQAALEGVAFALSEGVDALKAKGAEHSEFVCYWGRLSFPLVG